MNNISKHSAQFVQLAKTLTTAGFEGEINSDSAIKAAMSTDNSVYQIVPDLIVAPRHADDLVTLLRVMNRPEFEDVPMTGRGAGTGTNGQSLNRGVIVDFRRHMNKRISLNAEEGWADVEPGMVRDDLNNQIRSAGWFFAPETSTSNRCTIGGMVSTDASGKGSRVYGKTSDNILGLELAFAEGLLSSTCSPPDWAEVMLERAEHAARSGRQAFIDNTPKINRRFTGYDLERSCSKSGEFEWWRLLLGAEGTLGLISQVRVKLRRIEAQKRLIVVRFQEFQDALMAGMPLLEAEPTALEVMDETVQRLAEHAGILQRLPKDLRTTDGQSAAYLFAEFNGEDANLLDQRVAACRTIAAGLNGAGSVYVASGTDEIKELWEIRSAGVGLLGKIDGETRPVAFVEDVVVPPVQLPTFANDFFGVLERHGLDYGAYGHIDVGCLHVRPALNLDEPQDRALLVEISDEIFELTKKYGGIFWGEHGKGVRGAYLRDWIGPEAYQSLQEIKAAFDPKERFNPGKIVSNTTPIMGIGTTHFRTFNALQADPLERAFRCNGNAQCLSYAATTPMCPSFKASADLRHSPKGRADALRAWHDARQNEDKSLRARESDLLNVLDSCLGCKACASQCPIQVDIPAMRTAFLADYYARNPRKLIDWLPIWAERFSSNIHRLSPFVSLLWPLVAPLGDWLTATRDTPRKLANRAQLPHGIRLREKELSAPLSHGTVILVQDWFTALFDAEVQHDVIAGLQALGYSPRILDMRPAGKAAHNAGDMDGFFRLANRLADLLHAAARTGAPLLTFEPAFGMMLQQEYVRHGIVIPEVLMVQDFLNAEAKLRPFPQVQSAPSAKLLSHCTEASGNMASKSDWVKTFEAIGAQIETPATGCCGMAGLFGHQKRHFPVSKKLFDMSWRAHMESSEEIFATGFSCRCQSERLTGQKPRHPLALIAELFAERRPTKNEEQRT